ncbi:hypothetical protein GCM10022262_00480 [Georgenia daeguensis]|uniref:Uncharacterized protein n=2 Tax=Georgenia daeguensis TaxID=908355 RepID=A0ABP8EP51_9MICO
MAPVIGPSELPPEQVEALRERARRWAAEARGYEWGTVDLDGLRRGTGLPPEQLRALLAGVSDRYGTPLPMRGELPAVMPGLVKNADVEDWSSGVYDFLAHVVLRANGIATDPAVDAYEAYADRFASLDHDLASDVDAPAVQLADLTHRIAGVAADASLLMDPVQLGLRPTDAPPGAPALRWITGAGPMGVVRAVREGQARIRGAEYHVLGETTLPVTSDEVVAQLQARLGDRARVWSQVMSVVIWCSDKETVVRAFEVCRELDLFANVYDLGASWTASRYHNRQGEDGEYSIARRAEPEKYRLGEVVLPPAHAYPVSWTVAARD